MGTLNPINIIIDLLEVIQYSINPLNCFSEFLFQIILIPNMIITVKYVIIDVVYNHVSSEVDIYEHVFFTLDELLQDSQGNVVSI